MWLGPSLHGMQVWVARFFSLLFVLLCFFFFLVDTEFVAIEVAPAVYCPHTHTTRSSHIRGQTTITHMWDVTRRAHVHMRIYHWNTQKGRSMCGVYMNRCNVKRTPNKKKMSSGLSHSLDFQFGIVCWKSIFVREPPQITCAKITISFAMVARRYDFRSATGWDEKRLMHRMVRDV